MKKFEDAEIEVVKFDNAVIATRGCAEVGPYGASYFNGSFTQIWNAEEDIYKVQEGGLSSY